MGKQPRGDQPSLQSENQLLRRELAIEKALERIRDRAMTMQDSSQLARVIKVVFEEAVRLEFGAMACDLVILDAEKGTSEFWISGNVDIEAEVIHFITPKLSSQHYRRGLEAWKNKESIRCAPLRGRECKSYLGKLADAMQEWGVSPKVHKFLRTIEEVHHTEAYMKYGYFRVASLQTLSEKDQSTLQRFSKAFEQTYTRFLDLKKAEAQAREAQIEAALERVRARSLAMQHSDELSETSKLLDEQVRELGMKTWGCAFHIYGENLDESLEWFSNEEGTLPTFKTPYTNFFKRYHEMGMKGDSLYVEEYGGKKIERHYKFIRSIPIVGDSLDEMIAAGIDLPTYQIDHVAYFDGGYLLFVTFEPVDETSVFTRFAKVFEQAYTRFLDLRRAEEQAREAQIETALERVRAASMAMHASTDLGEVAKVMFDQLDDLGIETIRMGILIFHENKTMDAWGAMANKKGKGNTLQIIGAIENKGHPILEGAYTTWKQKKKHFRHKLKGNDLKHYYQTLAKSSFKVPSTKGMPKEQVLDQFHFAEGAIYSFTKEELDPDSFSIFERFTQAFGQAYRRYLDIQRAEAQTREAQIEVALERVRAASLAMHKSDELTSVIKTMVEQMEELGVEQIGSSISIVDEKMTTYQNYTFDSHLANNERVVRIYPELKFKDLGLARMAAQRRLKGEDAFTITLKGKRLKEFIEYSQVLSGVRGTEKFPYDKLHFYFKAFYGNSALNISSLEILDDSAKDIIQRMAKTFGLTFQRFLDLQRAEAQVKEAQIEAALERVRAASMAMHQSEELEQVIQVVYDQMVALGIKAEHAGFAIDYRDGGDWNYWVADPNITSRVTVPRFDSVWERQFKKAVKKKQDLFATLLDFEVKNAFYQELLKHIPTISRKARNFYMNCPGLAVSTVIQKDVLLYIENFEGTPYTEEENNILSRFGKVFQQAYTRFLDLKNAEEQAREARIEASLERVRSRTMAMHQSTELAETCTLMYRELKEFEIVGERERFHIVIRDPQSGHTVLWGTQMGGDTIQRAFDFFAQELPKTAKKHYDKWANTPREKRKGVINYARYKGRDLKIYSDYLKKNPAFAKQVDIILENTGPEGWIFTESYFAHGVLMIHAFDEPDPAKMDVLKRFAAVFEQTYQRYLDLRRAEEQAKEAQIEASLERVRAASLAMHKSEDLNKVLATMFAELAEQGLDMLRLVIWIYNEEDHDATWWAANPEAESGTDSFHIPWTEHEVYKLYWDNWEKRKKRFHYVLKDKVKESWDEYLFNHSEMARLPGPVKKAMIEVNPVHLYNTYHDYGLLMLASGEESGEDVWVIERYSQVFNQSYTRFLDLKRAEAQARESQIEAALERIRAASLAMHESSELLNVITVISKQLEALDVPFNHCSFGQNDQLEDFRFWTSVKGMDEPVMIDVPRIKHPMTERFKIIRKKKLSFYADTLTPAQHERWNAHMYKHQAIPWMTKKQKEGLKNTPFARSLVLLPNIFLVVSNKYGVPFGETDNTIIKRMGAVFEQAYTRFLDLKKAEAQAREAQIEAAMERIRSRALAMRTSEELMDVMIELRKQIDGLGQLDLEASVVHLYPPGQSTFESIAAVRPPGANGKIVLANVTFPVDATSRIKHMIRKYHGKESEYTIEFDKKMAEEWQQVMMEHAPMIAKRRVGFVKNRRLSPHSEFWNFADFSDGSLLLVTHSPASADTKEVLRKAAHVFDLAYRRFKDLKSAEAREKDAVKQASLDRVRAEIASMRTTKDLERITPLIWQELTTLGVPFFRCGVFIVNDAHKTVETYLTTPNGESLAAMRLPYGSVPLVDRSVKHWKEQTVFSEAWTKEEFVRWSKSLLEMGQIKSRKTYQGGGEAPDHLVLQMVPFNQGLLYVGSAEKLDDDQIELVESLARSFSVAYARYEDFVELEAAKGKVEDALQGLQAAQNQLIQSEKMASLGELTAGIAHEIQNPLNFVNNFADVSGDLIEELKEERARTNGDRDEELENEILDDIIQNLEKINHHGQRASSIVKGMLSHSRTSDGTKEPTDINALADEYLRLAYHGLRAKDKSFQSDLEADLAEDLPKVEVVTQEIGRVILNLVNNAFQAVHEYAKSQDSSYKPQVVVRTKSIERGVQISVQDNGGGISDDLKDKIFQPFFTTKATGEGTGLGLSLSYDIVTKGHGGNIKVKSPVEDRNGTEFIITLPIN